MTQFAGDTLLAVAPDARTRETLLMRHPGHYQSAEGSDPLLPILQAAAVSGGLAAAGAGAGYSLGALDPQMLPNRGRDIRRGAALGAALGGLGAVSNHVIARAQQASEPQIVPRPIVQDQRYDPREGALANAGAGTVLGSLAAGGLTAAAAAMNGRRLRPAAGYGALAAAGGALLGNGVDRAVGGDPTLGSDLALAMALGTL